MKRLPIMMLVLLSLLLIGAEAKTKKKSLKKPCAVSLDKCAREGCSKDNHHDPELNKLKNLKSSSKPVEDSSLTEMIELEKKVRNSKYEKGDPRDKLTDFGEGTQVRVV